MMTLSFDQIEARFFFNSTKGREASGLAADNDPLGLNSTIPGLRVNKGESGE
jgi:hypothetical protein